MKGKELIDKLTESFLRVSPSEKNFLSFKNILSTIAEMDVSDYFFQIKKNNKGDGLALEIMLFNKSRIIDLVGTRTSVDFITVLTQEVKKTAIIYDSGQNNIENPHLPIADMLKFSITYGDLTELVYTIDSRRLDELNRININLLNLLS